MLRKKIQIGKLLVEKNLVNQEQLDKAIIQQNLTGKRLGQTLIDLGYIQESKLLEIIAQQLNIPFIDLKTYALKPEIVNQLPELYARNHRAIVLSRENSAFLVGMVDPQNVIAYDELQRQLKSPIHLALVSELDLLKIIDIMYRHGTEISSLSEELSEELTKNDFDASQLTVGLSSSDAPVVKLLQTIFNDAVQVNASDVHIEPAEVGLRIRQRIDGILHEQILKDKQVAPALTLRLKLMAGLNITEKRLPQDGRFSIKIREKNFDVRLSTMPVQYGESVVMRLLNQSAELFGLDHVGIPHHMLLKLRRIITMPNGILLVTGPTGSGKTTTLYSVLKELNTPEKKIISVEDPVEYRMARVNQIQVQPKLDLTFARVLRSVLRQDPDIIMIGELRDQETVSIALRASMTGHFVLSTLHTNDAISSAIRLIDMEAERYLVSAALRAVIAQRLVRRICQNCITEYKLTAQEKNWLSAINGYDYTDLIFKQGIGCPYCHNTGYKGQMGVFEFLEITPYLSEALRLDDTAEFRRAAREDKEFKPLVLSGLDLVGRGITTISEVMRVSGEGTIDIPSEVKSDAFI